MKINTVEHITSRSTTHRLDDASINDVVLDRDPSNGNDSSATNMISISIETYKELFEDSVELYKAKDTIKALNVEHHR